MMLSSLGRALDEGQAFPLFVGELRVEGEVGHAEDGVHRRADLVAHVGQEVALERLLASASPWLRA